MEAIYEVALWRYWPAFEFPFVDDIVAESALLAVLSLMQQHRLKAVARAAVKCPDGSFRRWEQGVRLHVEGSSEGAQSDEVGS